MHSTVPLDTGKENNNFIKIKALDHSDELGALNNLHKTNLQSNVDKDIKCETYA